MWCVDDRDVCTKYSAQIQSAGTNCKAQDQGFLKVSEIPGLIAKNVDFQASSPTNKITNLLVTAFLKSYPNDSEVG